MSYTVIARKYRPKNFDDLIGQGPIADTLKNAIEMQKIHHAFLFAGPRGVGKTSSARILAKSLNCQSGPTIKPCQTCKNCVEITDGISMDVIEIDGASNRGINEIRELKEKINYRPIQSTYKIYIIDEVHMLTPEAFNALLKTLEEPPEHIIFMFATTEPHKIPLTVLSRCQRFDFRRITTQEIAVHLEKICETEKVNAEKDALFLLAKNSDGSMRDAQSALDQLIAYSEGKINPEKVRKMFGLSTSEIYHMFLLHIKNKDIQKGFQFISEIYTQGLDLKLFITNFIDFLRNLFLVKNGIEDGSILEENKSEISQLKEWSQEFDLDVIDEMIKYLITFLENFRYSTLHKILLEIAFINLIDVSQKLSLKFIYKYINSFGPVSHDQKSNEPTIIENKVQDLSNKVPAISIDQEAIDSNVPEQEEIHDQEEGSEQDDKPDLWAEMLKVIDQEKKSIGSFLHKADFQGIDDNVVNLALGNKFLFDSLTQLKPDIEKILKEKMEKDYRINFELKKQKEQNKKTEEQPDPVIQNVKKILKGKVISNKKEAYT